MQGKMIDGVHRTYIQKSIVVSLKIEVTVSYGEMSGQREPVVWWLFIGWGGTRIFWRPPPAQPRKLRSYV